MCTDRFDDIQTLGQLLVWRAVNQGDVPAFAFLGRDAEVAETDNFASLAAAAAKVARQLQQAGLRPGEPVVLAGEPGLGFVRALWGLWLAGAVAVPCYPPTSEAHRQRLRAVLAITGARFGIAAPLAESDPLAAACRWLTPTDAAEPAENRPLPPVQAADTALIQFTSGSIGDPKGVVLSHANILANARQIQMAFVHSSKSRGLIWLPPYHDMGLMGGLVQPVYAGFRTCLMAPRTFLRHPLNWLKAISRSRATVSGGPNFAYQLCAGLPDDEIAAAGLDLSCWQVAFNGAEPVSAEVLLAFAAKFAACGFRMRAFMSCYGLAEASLYVSGTASVTSPKLLRVNRSSLLAGQARTAHEPTAGTPAAGTRLLVSCGMPGQAVRIVDPQTLRPCPHAAIGEIWVQGENAGQGYYGQPELSAASFGRSLADDPRTYLRTGDLGFLHGGELYITGRIKDLIIINGRNHYPEDIEASVRAALGGANRLPGAAVAMPKAAAGETEEAGPETLAIIQEVPRHAATAEAEHQIGLIQARLAQEHGIAAGTILLVARGSLPRTSSGKIRRSTCRDMLLAGQFEPLHAARGGAGAPCGAARLLPEAALDVAPPDLRGLAGNRREQALLSWLMQVLAAIMQVRIEDLRPDTHLGLYGIDSLAATVAAGHISDALGIELESTIFWDYPNFTLLSRHLAGSLPALPALHPA